MTLLRFLIALACLVLGITAGFAVAKLPQNPSATAPSISSGSTLIHPDNSRTPVASTSPFLVLSDSNEHVALPMPDSESCATDHRTISGTADVIDYMSLTDYRYLMDTLSRIDFADEQLIWQWIEQAPVSSDSMSVSRIVNRALFQRLSVLRPSSVVLWIEQRDETSIEFGEDALLSDAIAGYSVAQPADAQLWLAALDPHGPQQSLVYNMTTTLGSMNPERMLAQLADRDEQGYTHSIINQWAYTNPAAALAWVENQTTGYEKEMYEATILESLMQQNPEAALDYMQNSSSSETNTWLLSRYASVLAAQEPHAALDWVFERGDPDVLEQAMTEIIWTWPEDDLGSLQARIDSIEDSALRERVMVNTASRFLDTMAEDDPSAAMVWVDSQSVSMQVQLRPQALSIWVDHDPSSAVQWLRQQPDSEERRQLLDTVIWQLPTIDLDLALDTFSTTSKSTRMGLIVPMIAALQQDRPSIVQQWISDLDDTDVQKIALTVLDDQAKLSNPELFLAELDQATGDDRLDKIAVLYRSFGSTDSELFEQWLSNNPLTLFEEKALQRRMEVLFPGIDGHCY